MSKKRNAAAMAFKEDEPVSAEGGVADSVESVKIGGTRIGKYCLSLSAAVFSLVGDLYTTSRYCSSFSQLECKIKLTSSVSL